MKERYLILDASTENETLTAIVPWTERRAREVDARLELTKKLKETTDDDLHTTTYWDDAELYEWLEEYEEAMGSMGWFICDEAPSPNENSQIRVSSSSLNISAHGHFWWSIMPKHGEANPYETRSICRYRGEPPHPDETTKELFSFESGD